jgi:hypothetical protein
LGAVTASLIAFLAIFGGALMGILLRRALPEHHLGDARRSTR